MTDYSNLYKGVSKIAWGFIFILININIVFVDILPDFVGYIFMIYGINKLKDECKTISLLKPLGIFLAVWNAASLILNFTEAIILISYISSIISIISIYFTFQLLTECSLLASRYQDSSENLDKTILIRRNINTVCITLMNVSTLITLRLPDEFHEIAVYIPGAFAVISLIVLLMTVSSLFRLKEILKKFDAANQSLTENITELYKEPTDSENQTSSDDR